MPKITCPSCSTSYELPDGSIDDGGRKVKCATCGTKWLAKPETIIVSDPVLDSVTTSTADSTETEDWFQTDPIKTTTDAPSPIDAEFEDVDTGGDVSLQMPTVVQEMPRQRAKPINPLMRSSAERNRQTKSNRYEIGDQTRAKRERILRPLALFASLALVASLIYVREPLVRISPDLASLYAFIGFNVNLRGFEIQNVRSERVVESGGPILIITGEIKNINSEISQTPKIRFGLKTNTNEEIYAWEHELSAPSIVPGGIARFQSRLPSPPPLGRNLSVRFTDS